MKTRKRLASLFLAMMMALSVMAMPAMAYNADGHDHGSVARKPVIECPNCGGPMEEIDRGQWVCIHGCILPTT